MSRMLFGISVFFCLSFVAENCFAQWAGAAQAGAAQNTQFGGGGGYAPSGHGQTFTASPTPTKPATVGQLLDSGRHGDITTRNRNGHPGETYPVLVINGKAYYTSDLNGLDRNTPLSTIDYKAMTARSIRNSGASFKYAP